MIATLLLLVSGALRFVPQDIKPTFDFADIDAPASFVRCSIADVNGDGKPDLITGGMVYFQANDAFNETNSAKFPAIDQLLRYDVWKNQLFCFTAKTMEVYAWNGKTWDRTIVQPIPEKGLHELPYGTPPVWERVLADVDQDGEPELLFLERDALCVYSKQNAEYVEAARLNVFSDFQLSPYVRDGLGYSPQLYPSEDRRILFPERSSRSSFFLLNNKLTVIGTDNVEADSVRFRFASYLMSRNSDGTIACSDPKEAFTTEKMPDFLFPRRLTKEGPLCFAGTREIHENGEKALFWRPLCETVIANDNGKTLQRIRSNSVGNARPFVDLDGDGLAECLTTSVDLFDKGLQVLVERAVISNEMTLLVEVRKQDREGHFALNPAYTLKIPVQLPAPPFKAMRAFENTCTGRTMDVSFDMSGDSLKDVVVLDRPNRIALYRSTPNGLESPPAATLEVTPKTCFAMVDLDGDGRGDLITRSPLTEVSDVSTGTTDANQFIAYHVYLTRETKP